MVCISLFCSFKSLVSLKNVSTKCREYMLHSYVIIFLGVKYGRFKKRIRWYNFFKKKIIRELKALEENKIVLRYKKLNSENNILFN